MNMYLILACLTAGLVSVATRFLWFHPSVFGRSLNKSNNKTVVYLTSFLVCTYLAWSMKWVNHPDDLNFILHGMFHGVMNIGVFAAGAVLIHAVAESKSTKYILIHVGYWLVTFALIGATLTSFPSFK